MNKGDLIAHVAQNAGLSKANSEQVVNTVFESITNSLKNGEEATFIGFGTFAVAKRAARTGRNPRTGEALKIAASKQAKFRPGKALKDAVNK